MTNGSMEVSTRRKTSSSGYRYARENDYEFDVNDISRASTPTSTFSSKSEGRKRDREHRYSVDDYKRKIARLRSELDLEKAKSKKAHKEKTSELKEVRQSYEVKKQAEIDDLEHKMKKRIEKERRQLEENLRNSIMEEKDKELQQVMKYKEDELKDMRSKFKREKESAIRLAVDNEQRVIEEKEKQMKDELEKMRKEKQKIESDYKKKCTEEARKEKEFTKIKEDYDAELRRILGESKKLALGNLEKLKKAEKALSENYADSDDDELHEVDFSELVSDLQSMQSAASSRAVSRSVSTTSELKFDELNMNINNLLASPAVTPGLVGGQGQSLTPGPLGHSIDQPSPLTVIKELQTESKSRSTSAMSEPAREIFSRKPDEKDRHLQKKVVELQTQTQRLERKIALLKTENETIKRKQDDKKPLEEKIKTLKKRNAELAAIARRLEEKAKNLQQENIRKTREMTQTQPGSHQGTEQMKKVFARQRAKDLAEHAKNMLSKDREIEDLRRKCQELADELSNSEIRGPENAEMYEEKEELVLIIKQAAKERLQLERQLAIAKPGPDCKVVNAEKYKELEETNETLKREIHKLERALTDTERLEIELTQKKLECERLAGDISAEKSKSKTLELQLGESCSQNTELTVQVSDLQQRLIELEKVNEECSTLHLHLTDAQHECEVAKGDVSLLQLKVQNLETVVKNLEFSTEKLKQVEKEYHEAVLKLQTKQQEIDQLQKVQESAREKYEVAIKALQDKIHGLETQCRQQAEKQQELNEELTELRAKCKKTADIKNIEIQTGKSIEFSPSATSSPNQSPRQSPSIHNGTRKSPSRKSPIKSPIVAAGKSPAASKSPVIKAPSPLQSSSAPKLHNSSINKVTHHEEIHTQPIVAAVKKPVSQTDQSESTKSCTDTGFADDEEVTQSNSPEPDKAEFEDPELFEIAKKLKELEAESDTSDDFIKTDKGEDSGMESRGDQRVEKDISELSAAESRLSALAKKGPILVYMAKYSYDPYKYSPNENPEAELMLQAGDYVLIYGEMDEDGFFDGELIDGRRGLVPSNFIEKVADEDLPDFHAALADHHDDDSTAANSVHIDLEFDSSEETDKADGLTTDDLSRVRGDPSSDLDDIKEEEDEDVLMSKLKRENSQTGAPFPKNLQLDRQLANSILVSWRPPDEISAADIRSYHVFLDGDFKTAIRGSERTKALLENVESRKVHRVSVRCVSTVGQSFDNQCTILVGKDVNPAPFDLRISDITATSASLTWTPGDSRFHHAILIDNVEVRVVKPAVFSYTLTGLSPATCHKVTVQARNLSGISSDNNIRPEKLSSSTEVTTTSGGTPDPPVNIQVESGPQEGSILLTWLPVTIDTSGLSKGALVAGYVVYADGQKAKDTVGATNDHVILSSCDFNGFIPKELVVRTVTKDNVESVNSKVVRLPHSLIKEITAGAAKTIATAVTSTKAATKISPLMGLDTEEELRSAFDPIAAVAYEQTSLLDSRQFVDSSCSELSDIPEVDEYSSPESANENGPFKETLASLVNGLSNLSNDSSDFEEIYQRNLTEETRAASSHDGRSPRVPSQQATPRKSHDKSNEPINKANTSDLKKQKSVEKQPGLKAVPQIEITRESSVEAANEGHSSSDKELVKTDSSESVKSSKVTAQQRNDKHTSKYSATMDKRDGYREGSHGDSSQSPHRNHSNSSHKPDISSDVRLGVSSPRGAGEHSGGNSPNSASRGERDGRSKDARSASPKSQRSPRGRSSPRDHGKHHHDNQSPRNSGDHGNDAYHGQRDQHGHHHRKSGSSPHHSGQGTSPARSDRGREGQGRESRSPQPSPNSKSNSKHYSGYRGNNDSSMVSSVNDISGMSPIDVISNRAHSDTNLTDTDLLVDDDEGGDVDSISGEINPPLDENRIRLFVALFDYDPEIMSPNVDALDEELPFREGQIIKVYGDKDADGFYRGECGGRVGFIPCNMVSEIQIDDPELEEQLLKEVQENRTVADSSVTAQLSASDKYLKPIMSNGMHASPSLPQVDSLAVRKMVALYDYDPQELSPNVDAEVELSFKTGDHIVTYGDMDEDGFYMGELTDGRRGLVPSNFLQESGVSDDEALDSVSVVTPARSGESINTSDSRKSEKSEKLDKQQQQQQQQQQHQEQHSRLDGSPTKLANTKLDQVEVGEQDIGMSRPRSLTPDELKQKKKSGGFLSKGKNILKKFTR